MAGKPWLKRTPWGACDGTGVWTGEDANWVDRHRSHGSIDVWASDGGRLQATVYNRTAEKAEPLVEKGARLAASPQRSPRQSDVVFTIVGYPGTCVR